MLLIVSEVASLPDVVRFVGQINRELEMVRVAALIPGGSATHVRVVREAGSVHVCTSVRKTGELVCVAGRHLSLVSNAYESLEEKLWARLPWSAYAN